MGGDALGEVAVGERVEHPDQILERGGHVLAQRIDRGADIEHEAGLAVEIDALREVAGDGGLHDAADGGFEVARHFLPLPLRDLPPRALGFLLLRFHLLDADQIFLEGLGGAGIVADLVAIIGEGNIHGLVAVGELGEHLRNLAERLGDAELADDEAEDQAGKDADAGDRNHQTSRRGCARPRLSWLTALMRLS